MGQSRVTEETSARGLADGHVQWAERVAVPVLSLAGQAEIRELCRVIRRRNDPGRPLSVGVFGQYSSGKSTLLNALLGAGLLPSSVRVTTSLATRLRPAERDSLKVTLRSARQVLEFGTSAFARWYASVLESGEPSGIRDALRGIMCSARAAQAVELIDLELARTILGPGVLVIDTPGFDATDPGHMGTSRLVADEVDLAIVLIPASDPGSMSLERFLSDVLSHLADRCIFVLTKFRQVPADERHELAEHIVNWLGQHGFPDATVIRADATDIVAAAGDLGTKAAALVSDLTSEISLDDAVAEARAIAGQLRVLAAERHQQLIEATLDVLLGRLLTGVTRAVEERRIALEPARTRLGDVPIVDLNDFLLQWRNAIAGELARSASRSIRDASWASAPDLALKRTRERAAEAVSSHADVRSIAARLISETEQILNDWTRLALRRAADSSGNDLARQAELLRQTFAAQYAKLAALTGGDPRLSALRYTIPSIALPYIDLSAAFAPLREKGEQLRLVAHAKTFGGAAVGATVGSLIFPVVGTALGGALGGLAGSASRGKQQAQFTSSAEAMHSEAVAAARNAVLAAEPELRTSLDNAVDLLIARYLASAGPGIQQLANDYRTHVTRLESDLREVLTILSDARRRQAELTDHRLRSQ